MKLKNFFLCLLMCMGPGCGPTLQADNLPSPACHKNMKLKITQVVLNMEGPLWKEVTGNWFGDDGQGRWTYGIYDSLAIMNNRFYTPTGCKKKRKRLELTLKDRESGRMATLRITPADDGSARISCNGGKAYKYLRTRPAHPAVAADEGYDAHILRRDSVCLQGYVHGYDSSEGACAGIVYLNDEIKRTDLPTVVEIAADGSFRRTLAVQHPVVQALGIKNNFVSFYAEPGDTVTLYMDYADLKRYAPAQTHYMGRTAHLSYLAEDMDSCLRYSYKELQKSISTLSPNQFLEKMTSLRAAKKQKAEELCSLYAPSKKATTLIRNEEAVKAGIQLLDFLSNRKWEAMNDTANTVLKMQPEASYYDFLKEMPLNDERVLINYDTDVFLNRYEYMGAIMDKNHQLMMMTNEEAEKGTGKEPDIMEWKTMAADTINKLVCELCGTKEVPLMWQIATVRDLKSRMKNSSNRAEAEEEVKLSRRTVSHPFLQTAIAEMLEELQPTVKRTTYNLPDTKAAKLFRSLIAPYKGKLLFVDFWATTCGPCRAGIERCANLREKYHNHPEFKFIYITSESESPEGDYNKYVEKNLKGETSYRLKDTEYKYLRELFGFNGIPHYVMVEKDGSILIEEVAAYNLEHFLNRRFGKEQ